MDFKFDSTFFNDFRSSDNGYSFDFGNGYHGGFVSMDEVNNVVYIGFIGTQNLSDVLTDLDCTMQPMTIIEEGISTTIGHFHNGCCKRSGEIFKIIQKILKQFPTNKDTRIILGGHSLGAGLAECLGWHLKDHYKHIQLMTFNGPQFTEATFKKNYENIFKKNSHLRCVACNDDKQEDPIVYLGSPFAFLYSKPAWWPGIHVPVIVQKPRFLLHSLANFTKKNTVASALNALRKP